MLNSREEQPFPPGFTCVLAPPPDLFSFDCGMFLGLGKRIEPVMHESCPCRVHRVGGPVSPDRWEAYPTGLLPRRDPLAVAIAVAMIGFATGSEKEPGESSTNAARGQTCFALVELRSQNR